MGEMVGPIVDDSCEVFLAVYGTGRSGSMDFSLCVLRSMTIIKKFKIIVFLSEEKDGLNSPGELLDENDFSCFCAFSVFGGIRYDFYFCLIWSFCGCGTALNVDDCVQCSMLR